MIVETEVSLIIKQTQANESVHNVGGQSNDNKSRRPCQRQYNKQNNSHSCRHQMQNISIDYLKYIS